MWCPSTCSYAIWFPTSDRNHCYSCHFLFHLLHNLNFPTRGQIKSGLNETSVRKSRIVLTMWVQTHRSSLLWLEFSKPEDIVVSKYFLPQAYADYLGFVLALNDGVKGKKITSEYKVSEVCCVVLCCVVSCCSTSTTVIFSPCIDRLWRSCWIFWGLLTSG